MRHEDSRSDGATVRGIRWTPCHVRHSSRRRARTLAWAPSCTTAVVPKNRVIEALGEQALPNKDLSLQPANVGGACHEVGTLRLGAPDRAVVDENLKWHGYENLYVCDLSVFPTSPAANPTLTLVALALRLARQLGR